MCVYVCKVTCIDMLLHFGQNKCVIGDGQYRILVIVKDVHAIHALTGKLGQDHKMIVRLFQVKMDVSWHMRSYIEVDDEVCIQYDCKTIYSSDVQFLQSDNQFI